MPKATHTGTCQACGARQKLPGGVLSTHGYTVDMGFFNGTCMGSGHQPYELSQDLIEETIKRADDHVEVIGAQIEQESDRTTDGNEGWNHCYMRELSSRTRGSVRVWKFGTFEHDGRMNYTFTDQSGQKHRATTYGTMQDLINANKTRRVADLERSRKSIRGYIDHQRQRIADWTPRPDDLAEV